MLCLLYFIFINKDLGQIFHVCWRLLSDCKSNVWETCFTKLIAGEGADAFTLQNYFCLFFESYLSKMYHLPQCHSVFSFLLMQVEFIRNVHPFQRIYLESRFAVGTNVPFFQELYPEGERCENNMNFNDVDDNIYIDDRIVPLCYTNRAGQVISKIWSQRWWMHANVLGERAWSIQLQ